MFIHSQEECLWRRDFKDCEIKKASAVCRSLYFVCCPIHGAKNDKQSSSFPARPKTTSPLVFGRWSHRTMSSNCCLPSRCTSNSSSRGIRHSCTRLRSTIPPAQRILVVSLPDRLRCRTGHWQWNHITVRSSDWQQNHHSLAAAGNSRIITVWGSYWQQSHHSLAQLLASLSVCGR